MKPPDQWIDVQKIEKLLTVWRSQLEECDHADGNTVMVTCINDLAFEIATRSLPTLADMTPEEREASLWMQADVKLANGGSATCVIANPRMPGAKVRVWAPHGGSDDVEEGRVTPLPDLPKLKWPGDGAEDALDNEANNN